MNRIFDRKIILEDGTEFYGYGFGAKRDALVELVFNTSMVGYQEILSDPSYTAQAVVMTYPLIGNYGMCNEDYETDIPTISGLVVREFNSEPSNFRAARTLEDVMIQYDIVGIAGVDTRMLTQMIRDGGVMNAIITTEETKPDLEVLKTYRVEQSVENTSTKEAYDIPAQGEEKFSVALLDYGAKGSIPNSLTARGCKVTIYPYNTPAEEILAAGHDGVMLSNGPGDPADNTFCIEQIQKLFGKIPLFGICLGHQMMALAAGAKTKKLKFGHRGANQPAMDLTTGSVVITSQNHGYAVDESTLAGTEGKLRYINVNDRTCEGVDYPAYHAFSLQFHPEAHGGPLDCQTAFDRFTDMMKEGL